MNTIKAGFAYALTVFAFAFMIGVLRVSFIAPVTGPLVAVLVELPLILAISWHASTRVVRRFAIASDSARRLAMGLAAFVLLMIMELGIGLGLGRSLSLQLTEMLTRHGALGLAGQIAFGLMPWIQLPKRQTAG